MHRPLAVLLAAVLLAAVASCGGDAKRDDAGQMKEPSDVSASTVRTGDCISGTAQGAVSKLAAVPCDQPHGGEAYHEFYLPTGPYPGDEPVATAAEQGCVGAFDDFIGEAYETSALEISQVTPNERNWRAGDRRVLCFVRDPERKTTGSLAGARR